MSEPRRHRKTYPLLKGMGSMLVIVLLLYLATFAVRFCLGLFLVGDQYILSAPGDSSAVAPVSEDQQLAEAATDPDEDHPTGRATILVTGDLMMHMPTVRSGESDGTYNFEYIYSYIKPYVGVADYAVVNLETTLSGTEGKEYTGYPKFNSPDAVASAAASAGFDLMLTGNNHCNDYGTAGLKRTLEVVRGAGLDTLGTYSTAEEQKYLIKELNGIRVGMACYTFAKIGDDPTRPTLNDLPTDAAAAGLVNAFDYDKLELFYAEVESEIAGMRASGAEAVVVFIHWGDDYTDKVSQNQKTIAQKLCDLGVDVIAGSHPHVVQTMDLLKSTKDSTHQTLVMYSLGNFLSNQRADNISLTTGQSEDGVLFSFTFAKFADGNVALESINLLPTWVLIRGEGDGRTYHVLPLDYGVEDWVTAYELTATQSSDARKSYSRTMQTLADSYDTIRGALAERNAGQNQEVLEPGVG